MQLARSWSNLCSHVVMFLSLDKKYHLFPMKSVAADQVIENRDLLSRSAKFASEGKKQVTFVKRRETCRQLSAGVRLFFRLKCNISLFSLE